MTEHLPDPRTVRDLARIRASTERIEQLLGLRLVAPGVALILVGLTSAIDEPVASAIGLAFAITVGLATWVGVDRHYRRTVGVVRHRTSGRELVGALVGGAALIGGASLDSSLEPPVSLTMLALAAVLVSPVVGDGTHWRLLSLSTVVAAMVLAPAWWGSDLTGSAFNFVLGTVLCVGGVIEHRRLDAALEPVEGA